MRLVVVLLLAVLVTTVTCWKYRRHGRRSTCATATRLRDKWHFMNHNKRIFLRIRSHRFVYRHGSARMLKYTCLENQGNIYLLRKRKYKDDKDGVLCIGFSLVADHPRAEYNVLRLIEPGEGTDLMSPVLMDKKAKVSIEKTCDLEGKYLNGYNDHITNSFIKRAMPGCKFPKTVQGRWNYTYQHAKSLEIWSRNSTLHLMNGSSIKFTCDKRDGSLFVFRTNRFNKSDKDAIMCVEFTKLDQDPFYSFQMARHSSGNVLNGQLKTVARGSTVYVHVDCDWIGSPARPEYLYP